MTGKSSVTERRSSAPASSLGAQMMFFNFSAKTLSAKDVVAVRCPECAAQPRLIGRMLDPRRGHTVRVFECECGEQTWTDEASLN